MHVALENGEVRHADRERIEQALARS
jgi:hypothetical protein